MKVAIHKRKGSFSDRWTELCRDRRLEFVIVDIFDDALFQKLRSERVDALLCHPQLGYRPGTLAAKSVIKSVDLASLWEVFPTSADYWHFDDKIAQKYLFDAAEIATPQTHVFLNQEAALRWAERAEFPWVFKLRAGAGSMNVSLLRTRKEAFARIEKMFGGGYPAYGNSLKDVKNKIRKHRAKRDWKAMLERAPRTLQRRYRQRKELDRERGYAYFQEFIADNDHDTRVTVIGNRGFAFRRGVRPGDFRASGSGANNYDPQMIDRECVKSAFEAAERLGTSCMTFDFVKRLDGSKPLIVEMSFGFVSSYVFNCPGHWLTDMSWVGGHLWPEDAILDDVLHRVRRHSHE
jgi:hypothetical protein